MPDMRLAERFVAIATFSCGILVLAACSTRVDRFAFTVTGIDGSTHGVEVRESPGLPSGQEGLLVPSDGLRRTPVYRLARPFTVADEGLAFVVDYVSDIASAALALYVDRGRTLLTMELPATGSTAWRCQAALAPGTHVWGFRIEAGPGEGSLALRSAGIEPHVRGFRFDERGLTLDGSILVTGTSDGLLAARFSTGLRDRMRAGRWQLELEIPAGGAAIRLSAPDGSATSSASFVVDADGPRRVILHEGSVGFPPRDLRVSAGSGNGAPAVISGIVSYVAEGAPIPADPGLILGWRRAAWRDPTAEVFSWPRLPTVLVLDTASYEIQERYFRRLAFFVEKPGTAGTVPTLASVEGRRSWNAHDYRAEDLARFYTLVADGPLTAEETRLRDVLLANGIIRSRGASYEPGAGAVLSISRESSPALRELLLTHEAFHGVFFALPAFQDACRTAWQALDGDERSVWLAYLELKGYNTADPYLVVNEFQSYLFQQERSEVPVFQEITLQRVREAYPELAPTVRRITETHPDSFLAAFDALDRALAEAGGPPGGRVLGVRRTSP